MTYPHNSVVVMTIAGNEATAFSSDASKESQLLCLGFVREGDLLRRHIKDSDDRKQLVIALATLGALFSEGKEWSPAELVGYYKEQGLPIANYRVIGWRSPTKFEVSVRS